MAPTVTPPAQGSVPQDQDPRGLHDIAVDVQTDLQKLATGLAHAGANPQAVAQITHMAEIASQIVKVLGGSALQQPSSPQGAPQGQPPETPPQQAQPSQPPQAAAPAAPPQHEAVHSSIDAASKNLHAAMIASKQQRQQGP
jgi:hypothetical protein